MTTVELTQQDPAYTPPQASAEPGTTEAAPDVVTIGESSGPLNDIKAAQGPLQPTAIDAQGVERIVGPAVDDNWRPAPSEAHPDEIAHLEAVKVADDARRAERLGATQVSGAHVADGHEVTKAAYAAERGV